MATKKYEDDVLSLVSPGSSPFHAVDYDGAEGETNPAEYNSDGSYWKVTGSNGKGQSVAASGNKQLGSAGLAAYGNGSSVYSPTSGFSFSGSKPGYSSSYAGQIDALLNQIMNREAFSYDYTEDPLYEQYRDQYTREGNLAMRDTMGSSAAMTGGYGNSYGTTAGSQAYQAYLGKLNAVVPELEQLAYQKYQDAQADRYSQLSALQALDNAEYNRYRDDVSDYYQDYDNAYREYADALSQANYEREFAYQQSRDQVSDSQWNRQFNQSNFQWQQEFDEAAQQAARELAYKYAAAGLVYPYDNAVSTWSTNQVSGSGGGTGSRANTSGSSGSSTSVQNPYKDAAGNWKNDSNFGAVEEGLYQMRAKGNSKDSMAIYLASAYDKGHLTAADAASLAQKYGISSQFDEKIRRNSEAANAGSAAVVGGLKGNNRTTK